jgi:hypothetical protein
VQSLLVYRPREFGREGTSFIRHSGILLRHHCDIKPENLMQFDNFDPVFLCDFGLLTSKSYTTSAIVIGTYPAPGT